jgi:RecA/RadA recombinase
MNEIEVLRTLEIFKPNNQLFEVRLIAQNGDNYSGYFCDPELCVKQLRNFQGYNCYFPFNEINDACYSRQQRDRIIKTKNATQNTDIVKREWILIDIDAEKPSGTSSTNDEKLHSHGIAQKIYRYLRDKGFNEPVFADSGNGYHLMYKCNLPNDPQTALLIERFLKTLSNFFSDKKAKVDVGVSNAGRITKLYGTIACKGSNTPERPHRLSVIKKADDEIKINDKVLFDRVVAEFPEPEKPTYNNSYNREQFSLDAFIRKHNIEVSDTIISGGATKYILDHCLFNDSHRGKDAALMQDSTGVIAYKCFHNSCNHYHWKDVRLMFEPDAYNNKQEQNQKRITINLPKKEEATKENTEDGKIFLSMKDVNPFDRSKIVSIPSGFTIIDKKLLGFNKGEVSVWSGKNGSAKSTVVNQIAINAVDAGFKGVLFSGELPDYKVKNWIHLQAAGRQFTNKSNYGEGIYFVKKNVADLIDKWLDEKLLIYNNNYGNNYENLMSCLTRLVSSTQIDFIVLDNVMSLDINTLSGDKYQQQTKFILDIVSFAKKQNIHIHIVAHPRKNVGFLRKDDISGTADLTNAVENVFICHRNNMDFKRASVDFFGKDVAAAFAQYSNMIEVCKNRDLGIVDLLVGLYFEPESKRLLNEAYENKVYGWQDLNEQKEMDYDDPFNWRKISDFDDIKTPF